MKTKAITSILSAIFLLAAIDNLQARDASQNLTEIENRPILLKVARFDGTRDSGINSDTRDHRTKPVVRDHRTEKVGKDTTSNKKVRDHRTKPEVRDHRTENYDQSSSDRKVRDHRLTPKQRMEKVKPFKEWVIGANKSGNINAVLVAGASSKNFYNLKNLSKRKFLQYEKQGAGRGINLGWTNNASAKTATEKARWILVPEAYKLSDSDSIIRQQPIKYGEKIAIAWVSPKSSGRWSSKVSFIKHSNRKVGIDLDWSSKPVYQWTILGGKPGTAVKRSKDKVVIYNLSKQQPLVNYPRKHGGQIGWAEKNGGSLLPTKKGAAKQPELPDMNVWKGLMDDAAKRSLK